MRRTLRIAGTALVIAGALCAAWGLVTWRWNDPVTAMYTRWRQHQLNDTYESKVAPVFVVPSHVVAAATTPAQRARAIKGAATRFRREVRAGEPIGRIRVPRLGLNMILVNGTDSASLKLGPGRDERTYMPGQGQLVYIAGHRTTYLAPFARIDRLQRGDSITLSMPYASITYRVTSHVIVPADDIARLRTTGHELVALQACHPRFSARERYIVYAKPVSVVPTGTPAGEAAAR